MEHQLQADNRRPALIVATMSSFLTPFALSAVTVALPSIARQFSMDAVMLSWVLMAFSLATAMFLLPFGRLADIYGRKRIFTLGNVLFTVVSLLLALAPSGPILIGLRALQGIAAAMLFGTGVSILTSVYPPGESRGKALGVNVAATYLGLSFGPFLGGLMTERFGWHSIFLAGVPLGLAILAVTLWQLRGEWAEARGERFDLGGSALYALALPALLYGFSMLPAVGSLVPIGSGSLALVAFVWWEGRVEHPVLDIDLIRHSRIFAFSNLAALLNYTGTAAVAFFLSLYLQYVRGLSPQSAGLLMVAQPIVQAALSPLAGRLSDRVEPRLVASTGMGLNVLGLLLFSFLTPDTSMLLIILNLGLLGLGFALFSSPNTNAIMGSVPKRHYGVASAVMGTMRIIGQTLSLGVATIVIALLVGAVELTPATHPALMASARVTFLIAAALCAGGVLASLTRGDLHRDRVRTT